MTPLDSSSEHVHFLQYCIIPSWLGDLSVGCPFLCIRIPCSTFKPCCLPYSRVCCCSPTFSHLTNFNRCTFCFHSSNYLYVGSIMPFLVSYKSENFIPLNSSTMILQFFFAKVAFFPFFGFLIVEISKNTLSLLLVAGTYSLSNVIFSALTFLLPILHMDVVTFSQYCTLCDHMLLLFGLLPCDQIYHAAVRQIFYSPLVNFSHLNSRRVH